MRNTWKVLIFGTVFSSISALTLLHAAGSFGADDNGAWRRHVRQAPTKEIGGVRMLPDGRLVAATAGSFHMYDGEHWKKYSYESPLLSNHIPFFSDSKGLMYFNDESLVIWDDGKLTRFESIKLVEPLCAAQSGSGGDVYFGSYNDDFGGVYRFDGSTVVRIYEGPVRSLTVDGRGAVWATTLAPYGTDMRLQMYENGTWKDRTEEIATLLPIREYSLTVNAAPDGSVWVCNQGPYGVWNNGQWEFFRNVGSGVPVSLGFDHWGGVWGFSSGKIYRLDVGKWVVNRTLLNILPNNVSFLAASDSVAYTFNSPDSILVRRASSQSWEGVKDPFDLGSDTVSCITYLDDGSLLCGHGVRGVSWVNSEKRGLSYYDGKSWTNFSKYEDHEFPNVYIMKKSPLGLVYFYSDGGYFTFDGKEVDAVDSLAAGLDATDMAWDSNGELWFATNRGLLNLKNPNYLVQYTGVMDSYYFVYNLCFDDADNMYMQSWSTQVLMTDQVKWYQYISGAGRALNDIAVEGNGKLWGARIGDLSWWDSGYQEWRTVADFPDSNRMVQIDPQGRVWASGYGKTGYYDGGAFRVIPELAHSASNVMTFAADGRIALNSFNRVRSDYYGIEEFIPSTVGVEDSDTPVSFLTASSHPNPFNPVTTIQFELPSPGRVNVTIYNIAGQRVKQLADQGFAAGSNKVEWDSRTDSGGMASSGVYFYRIEAGRQVRVGKMLLLR